MAKSIRKKPKRRENVLWLVLLTCAPIVLAVVAVMLGVAQEREMGVEQLRGGPSREMEVQWLLHTIGQKLAFNSWVCFLSFLGVIYIGSIASKMLSRIEDIADGLETKAGDTKE